MALAFLLALPLLGDDAVRLVPVASGLEHPTSMAHAGDTRLFITQQSGVIRIHDGTRLLPEPFLDLSSLVSTDGERGLLSMAFHPRFHENGFFFVNYTDRSGNTAVERYRVSATDANRADPSSAYRILSVLQPFANHNGGQLQFGPDGYLYIGMGDGGSGGDPDDRGQTLSDILGKMLRIDVDSGTPYATPPSNPFIDSATARHEIWAYGFRNPWRFSFDRVTGDLWIADVGQGSWEEVDFQPASSAGGENYGWRRMEGTHCFNTAVGCSRAGLVLPVIEYGHTDGACSITGGYVYRGSALPALNGEYVYGDFCNGNIWGATRDAAGQVTSRLLVTAPFMISTFGEDVNGELYAGSYDGGTIYRLSDPRSPGPRRRAARH